MESRVKLFGHPVHPMLVAFPLGLLATGVIFDVIFMLTRNTMFSVVSYWMITAGIIGGLLAAVVGFTDWLSIPAGTRAKDIGLMHGLGNLTIVVLFIISWLMRRNETDYVPGTLPFILELLGAGLALFTAWLGGEMVYQLGMGVNEGANLDAPSSLTGEPSGTPPGPPAGRPPAR